MKVIRILIVAAVLLAAFTQLHAQPNVETLTVDTLCYLGKNVAGEAAGALFLPDGNIIAMWKDTPLIIDSKSGVILRRLDSCNSETVINVKLSKDGTKFVATKLGPTFVIWDVPSGKIIKTMQNVNDYNFSPNGTKLYVCGGNSSKLGAIRVLDINTFEEIERFGSFVSGWEMDISPDGQTLSLSVYKEKDNENDKKTNQVVLIDLKDKNNYTLLETLEPQVYSMEFSPDGKQIAFLYHNGNGDYYIYIYNLETKEKKYIREQDLSAIFGFTVASIGNPNFIDLNTILFEASDLSDDHHYNFSWNLIENQIKNFINLNYNQSIDLQDSTILLCNYFGLIGVINKNIVPVKDIVIPNESYLKYNNNQLEYVSDKAFIGESLIFDTTGKLIIKLGTQPFIVGKNIIRVNQNLPIGVYILIIKNGTEQISKKFIVE